MAEVRSVIGSLISHAPIKKCVVGWKDVSSRVLHKTLRRNDIRLRSITTLEVLSRG